MRASQSLYHYSYIPKQQINYFLASLYNFYNRLTLHHNHAVISVKLALVDLQPCAFKYPGEGS